MEDKLEFDEHRPLFKKDIKEVLQQVYDSYKIVVSRNEYLTKENESLKSEAYKDTELANLKSRYETLESNYHRGFPISKEEMDKIREWMDTLPETKSTAIGGRYHYEFYPTSVGTIGIIVDDVTGKKFQFQDI